METLGERARKYSVGKWDVPTAIEAYKAGAREQKAIDDAEFLKFKSSWESEGNVNIPRWFLEGNIIVPRWFLEVVEDTLGIEMIINDPDNKELGESCQDRNIRQSLNGLRKLLNGEELSGMERFEKLKSTKMTDHTYEQGYHDAIEKACERFKDTMKNVVSPESIHMVVDGFRKSLEE